jgi:hypothetical protein
MNASASAISRSKAPHETGQGIDVRVLWPSAVLDEIDQWSAAQTHKPSRSEAILQLVQQALASTADKQPANRFVDALARVLLPEGNTESIGVEVPQTPREVRWKPRLVEATHLPPPSTLVSLAVTSASRAAATPETPPVAKPAGGNTPYAMPEDIRGFNEYWRRAEHLLGRHLEYEEVVASYNRCREGVYVDRYCRHLIASFD